MDKIKIIIGHGVPLFRLGLSCLLNNEPDIECIATTGDSEELLRLVAEMEPVILIIGTRMPKLTGSEIAQQIKMRFPDTKIVVIADGDYDDTSTAVREIGIEACLNIHIDYEGLIDTINLVNRGGRVSRCQDYHMSAKQDSPDDFSCELGQRELEVLCLAAIGLTNRDIAALLKISQNTVGVHLNKTYAKLGIHSRSQAVVYALSHNLIRLSGYCKDNWE